MCKREHRALLEWYRFITVLLPVSFMPSQSGHFLVQLKLRKKSTIETVESARCLVPFLALTGYFHYYITLQQALQDSRCCHVYKWIFFHLHMGIILASHVHI